MQLSENIKINKTSPSQIRASVKWNQANKEKHDKIRGKSATKKYILELITEKEELEQVKYWIKIKENNLK
ncbi:hypothetical protein LV469_01275 [Peptoniphilus sp. GNH]|nr:hypothetical protein LV469_01275 [Peptoniphilus sp. GNH]